ncbi:MULTISPECIES: electron transport complex subunit RsxC [unclassified Enterococcus]|uniref:electron transport complex subunit RsxC n=1 Tax=unclassified Enterococcus TaxID=2608891 RepID=UPI001CE1F5F3|nr:MULTISPECIES: electron transport complex subunit RsxC [unclassified Enterococcus]MCA5014166.1 electron transport complex subunit RsxC [Enterococcus sp. S23]MCA5017614.1 electron transport complex subunit RsxC [Enterococcus sp. S22(2020)]
MFFSVKRKRGCVKIVKNKRLTELSMIQDLKAPEKVILPMNMHIGKPARVIVTIGESVKIGTLIGAKDGAISANIHSSVSGTVEKIEQRVIGNIKTTVVVIRNDFKDTYEIPQSEPEDVVSALKDNGIVGMGGAGFPTDVKFFLKEQQYVETLIINAVECEPFVTADRRIILEYTKAIIEGITLFQEMLSIKQCVIAIGQSSTEAIAHLQSKIENHCIDLKIVPSKYPQGAEKLVIKTVTGKELPKGKLPIDLNVVIINVSTLLGSFYAFKENLPLTERIITVSGHSIKHPQNLRVRIGTPIDHVIEGCGGFIESPAKLINGGPMMGKMIQNLNEPVTKTTSLVLALTSAEVNSGRTQNCIRCSECINTCPVNLQPISISHAYRSGNVSEMKRLGVLNCIDCGACSYICPSKIDILDDIRAAKQKVLEEL